MVYRYNSLKGVKEYLDIVYKNHQNNWDTVIAIVGKVGVGKSNLALHMLEYWNQKINGKCDPEDIKNMCLNREDFMKRLSNCKKKEMIIYDEAGDISSRSALDKFNKQLMVAYQIIRGDNLFTVLVLPDIWDLDSYFRNKRIKGLFYVKERGKVAFWNRDKIEGILAINQYYPIKNYFAVSPDFTDTYPIYKGAMQDNYKELKENKLLEFRKNLLNEKNKNKDNKYEKLLVTVIGNLLKEDFQQWRIAKVIEKTQPAVNKIIKRYEINNE